MFFSSIKEINTLLRKGMSNIYLKSNYWEKVKHSKLRFSKFKKLVFRSFLGKLQLTQISMNFQTSCCMWKIMWGLGAKLCVAILLFSLWKEIWRFKIKESMIFAEQKYSFNKNERESKMENITHSFTEMNLVLRLE